MAILDQLDDQALALNVLRPLTVDSETEVRQNFNQWIDQIHNMPNLQLDTEKRLLEVLTQFITQKFKTLPYEELRKMIQLTPLKETVSGQGLLHDNNVELLTKHIKRKYRFADSTMEKLEARLRLLTLQDLEDLLEEIIDMETLREINAWVSARTPRERRENSGASSLSDE